MTSDLCPELLHLVHARHDVLHEVISVEGVEGAEELMWPYHKHILCPGTSFGAERHWNAFREQSGVFGNDLLKDSERRHCHLNALRRTFSKTTTQCSRKIHVLRRPRCSKTADLMRRLVC